MVMSLDLSAYAHDAANAVTQFWQTRTDAAARQQASGNADHGERSGVTAGKNMDGFIKLLTDLARANGLAAAEVCTDLPSPLAISDP